MLRLIKQARAAFSMLKADEVNRVSLEPVNIGLVADGPGAYAEMEDFLVPRDMPRKERLERLAQVHRASDHSAPDRVDVVLYEPGVSCPQGAFHYHRDDPSLTVDEILREKDDISLSLARQFAAFRPAVIERVIHEVARENAMFTLMTALPNVMPNLIELPWIFGEFASDTAFLTANQVRMAFQIAAACDHDVGLAQQKLEVLGIAGGAFGWRALARELVSHIPLGGGLIPKSAIAYAGTYVAGKGLELLYLQNARHTLGERKTLYQQGLERGREVARRLRQAG
jgi:hypothetical protein